MSVRCAFQDSVVSAIAVPVVFFFRESLDETRLAATLADALEQVPIFGGRVHRRGGELLIDCANQGVAYTSMERTETMEAVLDDLTGAERSRVVDHISPRAALAGRAPVASVRVVHYRGGGTSIGVCWHHVIGDMATFMFFMNAWARAYKEQAPEPPLLIADRIQYLGERLIDNGKAPSQVRYLGTAELAGYAWYLAFEARRKQYLHFCFVEEELKAMREELSSRAGQSLSINDALCAHMFSVIERQHGNGAQRFLSVVVDIRKHAKLPPTICGNMFTGLNIRCAPGRAPEDIAGELRNSLNRFAEDHMDYWPTVRFAEDHGGMAKAQRFLATAIDPMNGNICVTNWSRFGAYDLGFGTSNAVCFMALWDLPFPWFASILGGPCNDGLVYSIALPRALAAKLQQERAWQDVHRYRGASAPTASAQPFRWLS